MTDSESDTSNVFTFQNVNTTVSAKGPNTNMCSFSFRNPMTSTMYMPRNFERQRYAESTSAYDQRSMYYRRETSPLSIHSACDIQPRNFQQYYPGMSSQRSVFNGRSGSPTMSMRSIDSSASVSAADIAFAFKNSNFNQYDLKVIKDAYHKLMKHRIRKRVEKRRNMKLFFNSSRRKSGDDSGEQGSNSSESSDDCRSVKTLYKENMASSRSVRVDLTDFRKTVRDSNMLKDCSDNFKQINFKNKFSVGSSGVNNTQHFNNTVTSKQINPMPTQNDRFRNGLLLPSQRFNKSVASSVIMDNSEKPHKSTGNNVMNHVKNHYAQNKHNKKNCSSGSEEEEIFSETTVREKSTFNIESQRKRSLDSEDESSLPDRKKSRRISPIKNVPNNKRALSKPKDLNPSNNNIAISNSFEFAKPSLPVRKSKPRVQEKLIAKSSQPLTDFMEPIPIKIQENVQVLQPSYLQEKSVEIPSQLDQSETTQNSDVSSRPSFIKRKLFTQKLDVAEKANLSSDSMNSPQNSVYSLQKEKNKARKLVTNQSCLNREVQDDSNLLDLIHKIVPPDRMNLTNQTTISQTKSDVNNKNKKNNEDKWDVTSVISMCNEDDVSDTYTDEEIFEADNTTKDVRIHKDTYSKTNPKTINKFVNDLPKPRDCRIMLEKIPYNNTLQKHVANQNFNLTHNNVTKHNVKSSVKTFWDTDFESDAECHTALPRSHMIDNIKKANTALDTTKQDFKIPIGYSRSDISKKSQLIPEVPKHLNNTSMNNTLMNNTVDSMRKFNTSTLSIRSHRTSKKKKCCNETCANETISKLDKQNKISADNKKHNSIKPVEKTVEKINSKASTQSKKSSDITKPSQSKKSPKEKKTNKDKQVVSPIKTTNKTESKSKTEKLSCANNKLKPNPETQKNRSAVNKKVQKQSETTKAKNNSKSNTQNDNKNNKKDIEKIINNKPKSKSDQQNNSIQSKKDNHVSKSTKSNLNNTVDPIQNTTVRSIPVRSCRTRSQSKSIELSRSAQLDTSVDINRSLRSRVINLSSSIENITIKIKPKKKIINNKNITQISTRNSDVSFSLGSNKQTPTPKKNLARSKADFFKGKRKT